jgi:hypothetical protein
MNATLKNRLAIKRLEKFLNEIRASLGKKVESLREKLSVR